MRVMIQWFLLFFFIVINISISSYAYANSDSSSATKLHLVGRSKVIGSIYPQEKESDLIWLQEKKVLKFGTALPFHPPFSILAKNEDYYEGITADYLRLISQLLNVTIDVIRYSTRDELMEALENGDVDFISTPTVSENKRLDLKLSNSYFINNFAIVMKNESDFKDLESLDRQLAFSTASFPPDEILNLAPLVKLVPFSSSLSAISAVYLGNVDFYIGDILNSNYLISKNSLNKLKVIELNENRMQRSYVFATLADKTTILRLINAALDVIPQEIHDEILNRWAEQNDSEEDIHVELTSKELSWLKKNPNLTVIINDQDIPLSYMDEGDNFRGISASVLSEISQLVGLKLNVKAGGSSESLLIKHIVKNNADILAVFSKSQDASKLLSYTNAYLTSPLVLATYVPEQKFRELININNKTLAIERNSPQIEFIKKHHPSVKIVLVDGLIEAMHLLKRGNVDAVAGPLVRFQHLVKLKDYDDVNLSTTYDIPPYRFSLATSRNSVELISILNKAMSAIPPKKMSELTRSDQDIVFVKSEDFHSEFNFYLIIVLSVLIISALLAWGVKNHLVITRKNREIKNSNDKLSFIEFFKKNYPFPIYLIDNSGMVIMYNTLFLNILDWNERDGLRFPASEIRLTQGGVLIGNECYVDAIQEKKPIEREYILTLPGGKEIPIYHWSIPCFYDETTSCGVLSGWYDVSYFKSAIKKITDEMDVIVTKDTAKTKFIATMSHEIRTPISAIIGMLELIQKKADSNVLDSATIKVAYKTANDIPVIIEDA